jgi:cysteine desulfuration protein SufE
MATPQFEELVEDFEFLEDWEDRYRHVIDQGKGMDALDPALCVPATKVDGCASQVWLHAEMQDGRLHFDGASDAMIVSGLIAVLRTLYNGLTPAQVMEVDARAEMGRLGLNDHLSAQRSNGLRAMVDRVQGFAQTAAR